MKSIKVLTAAAVLCISTAGWSEDAVKDQKPEKKDNPPEVLFNLKESSVSGYGGIYTRFSKAGDTNGCFVGGRGGFIINDSFVVGAGGMGLVNPGKREKITGNEYTGIYDEVQFGYGGFLTEYYFNPKDLVVFSIGTLIGGGGLYFTQDKEEDENDHHEGGDNFFVLEPELNVFIHLTRFCRIGAGVSYRYVNGINSEGMDDSDFRGPAASAMVQFGWF